MSKKKGRSPVPVAALPVIRSNVALRNFDPWYQAFDVKPGDAMYLPPEQRVRIW